MLEITYKFIDKSTYPHRGPWDDECDRKQWSRHEYVCLIRRNHCGAWCGYVGIPADHPYYEKNYSEIDFEEELTWGDFSRGEIPKGNITECPYLGINHIPEKDTDCNLWWLGFDFAHAWHFAPNLEINYENRDHYVTQEIAEHQVNQFADFLKKAKEDS